METPERNQIGSPVSKYEDSPVFNYLSSLSPVKPVKSVPITLTFTSLNCNSIPSVFTSPHVISRKESRFIRRQNIPDKQQPDIIPYTDANENKENEVFVDVNQLHSYTSQICKKSGALDSLDEAPLKPLNKESNHPMEFCQNPKCDYDGSLESDSREQKSAEEDASQSAEAATSSVMFDQGPSVSVLSEGANLLMFDSPSIAKDLSALFKSPPVEPVGPSLASQFPQDTPDFLKSDFAFLVDVSSQQNESYHLETEGINSGHNDYSNTMVEAESMTSHLAENAKDDVHKFSGTTSLHRGVSRRCLMFDTKRGHGKNVFGASSSNPSMSMLVDQKISSNNRKRELSNTSSLCVIPRIGLHLNSLAVSGDHRRGVETNVFSSAMPFQSPTTVQESLHEVLAGASSEKNVDSDIVPGSEDASLELDLVSLDDFNQNSPMQKRHKQESSGDESCKHCNCKKSKCLKLYCDCFAAGVYCTGTCACQGCLNRSIHEEIVLATGNQIESRNPLAFAPKVIMTSDSLPDAKDEFLSTPASARHKRGCNCKKSGCQKKYCECYQGGVGCSVNCRCKSCKNVFGIKDGKGLAPLAQQDDEDYEDKTQKIKTKMNNNRPQKFMSENNEEPDGNTFPETPLHLTRISFQLPVSSNGKPPRSSLLAGGSASRLQFRKPDHFIPPPKFQRNHPTDQNDNEMPVILQSNGSPDSSVKISFPNSKRVSSPRSNLGSSSGRRSTRKLILQSIPSFPSLTQP